MENKLNQCLTCENTVQQGDNMCTPCVVYYNSLSESQHEEVFEIECTICPSLISAKDAAQYDGMCEECVSFGVDFAPADHSAIFLKLIQHEQKLHDLNLELDLLALQCVNYVVPENKYAWNILKDCEHSPYYNRYVEVYCEVEELNNMIEELSSQVSHL